MERGPKKNWEVGKNELRMVLAFWRVDMQEPS